MHGPHKVIPWTFVTSAITMALIWAMGAISARGQAIALYLQVSAIGMIQISGFWPLINESYAPPATSRTRAPAVSRSRG